MLYKCARSLGIESVVLLNSYSDYFSRIELALSG